MSQEKGLIWNDTDEKNEAVYEEMIAAPDSRTAAIGRLYKLVQTLHHTWRREETKKFDKIGDNELYQETMREFLYTVVQGHVGILAATVLPVTNPGAKRFERLSYAEVLSRDLKVMDGAAIALARDNGLPVIVFSIEEPGNLLKMLQGKARATVIE